MIQQLKTNKQNKESNKKSANSSFERIFDTILQIRENMAKYVNFDWLNLTFASKQFRYIL